MSAVWFHWGTRAIGLLFALLQDRPADMVGDGNQAREAIQHIRHSARLLAASIFLIVENVGFSHHAGCFWRRLAIPFRVLQRWDRRRWCPVRTAAAPSALVQS